MPFIRFEKLKSGDEIFLFEKKGARELKKRKIEDTGTVHAVKLTYRSAGRDISKRLFGYGPWNEKKADKIYRHKSVHGLFQGTLMRKCGRACLIVPQELEKPVKETIVRYGGEIRSTVPVVMTREEVEEMADVFYANYLKILMGLLRNAYEADNEKDFKSAMKRAASLTKKFESLIEEASIYAEEKPKPRILHHIFDGLRSISNQDFEAAKLQTEFLGKNVEREYNNLLKSLNKQNVSPISPNYYHPA
jgi:hypothetical protein